MIRPYTVNDKRAILHLFRLNTPDYFSPSEEKDFMHYLDHELEWYYVFEEGGEVIGCGGLNTENEHEMCISWDIIHPDHHGKGIGRQLVEYRVNQVFQQSQVRTLMVRTSQHTDRFYRKMGFGLVQIKKDYWAPGFDLYEMRMDTDKTPDLRG